MKVPLYILCAICLAACGPQKPVVQTASNVSELIYKTWVLKSISVDSLKVQDTAYIVFNEKGDLRGFGACNRFTGQYTMSNSKITISKLASTKMYCNAMAVEDKFLSILPQVDGFAVEGKVMVLRRGPYDVMRFETE